MPSEALSTDHDVTSAHHLKDDDGVDSTDLAAERTDWAEDRTVLANERTFAGWMRTGMAALAIAIGMHAVFGATEPTWLAKGTASLFVTIAIGIFAAAWRQSGTLLKRLDSHAAEPVAHRYLSLIAMALIGASLCALAVLWLL